MLMWMWSPYNILAFHAPVQKTWRYGIMLQKCDGVGYTLLELGKSWL